MYAPLAAFSAGATGFLEGKRAAEDDNRKRLEDQAKQWDLQGLEALGRAFQPQPGPIDQLNARAAPQPPMPGQPSMPMPRPPVAPVAVAQPPQTATPPQAPQQGGGSAFGGLAGWAPGERPIGISQPPAPPAPPPAVGAGGPPPVPSGAGGGPTQQPAPPQTDANGMPQMDLRSLASRIQQANPGLPPQAMVAALTRAAPLLSMQGKAELAQMRLEMQKQNLDLRRDALDARRDAAEKKDETAKDEVSRIVDGIADGKLSPNLTGLYGKRAAVEAGLEKKGVDLSKMQLEWKTAERQIASLNSQRMFQYRGLATSVMNTIDRVKDLSEEMQNIGIPAINRAKIAALIQTEGNSEKGQLASQYLTAVNTLKEEFANLANGGYAPTESAWALANSQINGDYGVKQLGASLDEVRRLIGYRLQNIPNLDTLGPASQNRYTGTPAPPPTVATPGAAKGAGGGGWTVERVQ